MKRWDWLRPATPWWDSRTSKKEEAKREKVTYTGMAIEWHQMLTQDTGMLGDNTAILYDFERKWLEALTINFQVWDILEIFLGIYGFYLLCACY